MKHYDCIEKEPGSGKSCVSVPSGPFSTMADCQAALNDPDSECNEGGGGEKYDCKHGTGCFQTPSGPYDSLQACEDSRDDHYNMGREFCECDCPGQPDGCDNTPLISPIMNNNGELGPLGQPHRLTLNQYSLNSVKSHYFTHYTYTKLPLQGSVHWLVTEPF